MNGRFHLRFSDSAGFYEFDHRVISSALYDGHDPYGVGVSRLQVHVIRDGLYTIIRIN